MVDCKRYEQFILAYIDEDLDLVQKKELERHLEICENCARCLHRLKALRSRLKTLSPVQTSETFQIVLRECVRRRAAGKPGLFGSPRPILWRLVPVAGVAVVLIVLSVVFIEGRTPSSNPAQEPTLLTRVASPADRNEDQIQYILEDYPNRISVSRNDSETRDRRAEFDTLQQRSGSSEIESRITTVSF
jgi:hypothetical protein